MDCITKLKAPDFETQRTMIYRLKKRYPFLSCSCCGRSVCSRGIFALSIGKSNNPVLLTGGFHGQEWLTSLLLLRFTEELCRCAVTRSELCGIDVTGALRSREVIIVPCVNPDGVQIALHGAPSAGRYSQDVERISAASEDKWNANARGVDINHNFDAGWSILRSMEIEQGITGPSPRRYGGYMPESEPETKAIADLCRLRKPRKALAFHSQGEEIYCAYGENTPQKSITDGRILAAASGYTLVENAGLASHGGFKDWFIEYFSKPAFTVEIGLGENPLPLDDFEDIYRKALLMMVLSLVI